MSIIPIGPFMMRADIVIFLICAAAGFAALRIRLRQMPQREWILDTYLSVLIIGFISWKFGMLVFDPIRTFQHPASLIYMTGGTRGIWLGTVLALIYAALRWNKKREDSGLLLKSALLSAFASGWAGYVFQWLWADGVGLNSSLFYMLLYGTLLTMSWLQFHSPLTRFLTLGLGRNGAVLLIIGALFVWVIYDFASTSASQKEAIVSPNVEGKPEAVAEGLKPGLRAPDFTLMNREGQEIKLSDYRGQTVLLNFWASWCPPCKVEMPYMQDFYDKYQDENVIILAVNMTHLENSMSEVQSFVEKNGLTFPVLYDQNGTSTRQYEVVAYPTTYVISPDGIISERFQGAIDEDLMVRAYRKASN
ncbi:redoxin domain-containing protein [Paenibacillus lautus]|uniref:redoxin domain-containing protein n=1 Tax=Paenibacillus lautus TaxID=1401 RepID=UPI000FDA908E|nr:redoxin domain-containing protein [Paenibacillus lautus]